MSRDQLLGYLWPESNPANARHSLEQLIHSLRRALGDSVFSGVNPVSLNSEVVGSDVTDFDRALARGALADAVALYDGPFLQGFYLDEAPEFERWASAERARLATHYEEALGRLASDAEGAGDHAAAVRWRRRLADADPVSSRYALALMRALAAAGDRTAALQHARVYESLVQEELNSPPDPSIEKYVAALRAGVEQPANLIAPPPTHERSAPPLPAAMTTLPVTPPVSVAEPIVEKAIASIPATRRRSYWWLIGTVLGGAVLLMLALSARNRRETSTLDQNKIVVVPFRTSGADSSVKYLGEGIADLIAPMLTGEGGPAAVDSRTAISTWNRITKGREGTAADARQVARELGAGLVLSGSVVETGGRLTITGNVIAGSSNNVRPLASVSAPSDSVDQLLDRFVSQLLVRQSGVADASVAEIMSQSLPAIRAYLSGRAAYRRADEEKAIESFTRAIDIDSTFALAALDLTVATGKLSRGTICRIDVCRVFSSVPGFASSVQSDDLFNRAVRLAWAYRVKLGKRDVPLLEALRGENYPRESSASQTLLALTRAVAASPDRPEAHYLLGVFLLYQGSSLGVGDSRVRAEAEFREASKLDLSYLAPLARMVDAAAFDRDPAKIRRAGASYLTRDTVGPASDYVRWVIAAGTGDVVGQRAIRARLRSLSATTLEQIFVTSQMAGIALEDADSATNIIAENTTDPIEKSVAFRRGQLLSLNRGRPSAASDFLERVDAQRSPSPNVRAFAIGAAVFEGGDLGAAESRAKEQARAIARDTLLSSQDAMRRNSAVMSVQSLWYLDRGDTAGARAAADWLRRHSEGQPRNRVLSVLPEMLIASRARRANGVALRAFVDSIVLRGCCELPEYVIIVLERAYDAGGDAAGALRVVRRGIWYSPPRQLSTLLREEGRLAASLGDRAGAIRAYEHYLALRSDPEPVLRPERDRIRAEVTRLKGGR